MSETPAIRIDGAEPEARFSRFELISWWDQRRLREAKVLVIGAGALGNELVKNAALLGIGNLLVADMDRIEGSNLSRSVLFRAEDEGRPKAEVACESARAIYPDVAAHPFVGNVVHDLGLGPYLWADVVLGGLDNREARVAVNRGAALAGKTWIDGAIEVLSGLVRVFDPAGGPCYECTMSEVDWKILQGRRSCALLTREEMETGKVPTTPTTGSVVAGLQVQEAVKLLHGLDVRTGEGVRLDGITGGFEPVRYPRKADCAGHERLERIEPLDAGAADVTVGELRARAQADLGPAATLELSRDIIARLVCPQCGAAEDRFASLGRVTVSEAACPACGQVRIPETLFELEAEEGLADRTFAALGVPPMDVVIARQGDDAVGYLFDGDAEAVLGPLAR